MSPPQALAQIAVLPRPLSILPVADGGDGGGIARSN